MVAKYSERGFENREKKVLHYMYCESTVGRWGWGDGGGKMLVRRWWWGEGRVEMGDGGREMREGRWWWGDGGGGMGGGEMALGRWGGGVDRRGPLSMLTSLTSTDSM